MSQQNSGLPPGAAQAELNGWHLVAFLVGLAVVADLLLGNYVEVTTFGRIQECGSGWDVLTSNRHSCRDSFNQVLVRLAIGVAAGGGIAFYADSLGKRRAAQARQSHATAQPGMAFPAAASPPAATSPPVAPPQPHKPANPRLTKPTDVAVPADDGGPPSYRLIPPKFLERIVDGRPTLVANPRYWDHENYWVKWEKRANKG